KYGIPYLLERGGGSVINVASFVAIVGAATSQISYTASKGAVLSMSKELGVQFARQGVRVNALCPGPVETPLLLRIWSETPGAAAVALPLDPSSGVVSNADAADDALSPGVTAATFARLGRITGYTLDYNDAAGTALSKRRGLLEIETGVELYRSPAAARAGLTFRRKDDSKLATLKLVGASFTLTPLKTPRLGDTQYAFSATTSLKGK